MKKKLFSVLLVLALAFSLCVPAYAYEEYGAIYDETEILGSAELQQMGETVLPEMTRKYGADLRVDIITTIGDWEDITQAAAYLYDEFGYGYGELASGLSLTVLVQEDETGAALIDWVLYSGGAETEFQVNAPFAVYDSVEAFMSAEAWEGDLDSDRAALADAVSGMAQGLEKFLLAGGGAISVYDPVSETILDGAAAPEADAGEAPAEPEAPEAAEGPALPVMPEGYSFVADTAGLLSAEEAQKLEEKAQKAAEKYGCGVYIVTLDDFSAQTGAGNIEEAATWLFLEGWKLGTGPDQSGVMLILSMAERDYDLYAHGYGNTAFTDYGKEYLAGKFLDDFGDDEWYGGFSDYMDTGIRLLSAAADGSPIDVDHIPGSRVYGVIACILIALILAFIITAVLKNQLKSVAMKTDATRYITDEGVDLKEDYDRYTHTTQTRVYEAPDDDSGSGGGSSGGGTSVDSSGSSHHSGKF